MVDRPSLSGGLHHTVGSSVSKGVGGGSVQQSGRKRKGSSITATPTAAVTGTGAKKGRTAKGATATVTVEMVTKPLALPSIPISSGGSSGGSGSTGLYEVVEGMLGQGILPFAAAACPQV